MAQRTERPHLRRRQCLHRTRNGPYANQPGHAKVHDKALAQELPAMTPHEIQRALRLITSKPQRQRFPIETVAQLAGLSRETVYQARAGNGLTNRVVNALSPILTAIVTGELQAVRGRWLWTVRKQAME